MVNKNKVWWQKNKRLVEQLKFEARLLGYEIEERKGYHIREFNVSHIYLVITFPKNHKDLFHKRIHEILKIDNYNHKPRLLCHSISKKHYIKIQKRYDNNYIFILNC